MEQTEEHFFREFRQEYLAEAEAASSFQLMAFAETVARELIETGFIEGFDYCHYKAAKGMRVDGFWFDEEGGLDVFVVDFEFRESLESLTRTEVDAIFKRAQNFLEACVQKQLFRELETTSPECGLARQIFDRKSFIQKINIFLLSERSLSGKVGSLDDGVVIGVPTSFHIWDISRLHRQRSARGAKEALDINLLEMFGEGLPCLPAHLSQDTFPSYLIVVPGNVLADLYGKYGARLLEQNVRSFLQARGKVNSGIRSTIIKEPEMFFAYNNGVTATAQNVDIVLEGGIQKLSGIRDLQIVNGGQTTASLFHTRRKDKVDLSDVFVQMKLSVVAAADSESVVPRISEYANTQNKVSAADFFSNHPFHIRMQEFSRRIWAPAQAGAQRETKWFYERARGQYSDEQTKLTEAEQKRFRAEFPKQQMFTKTDLAKYENVWDEHPRWVNLGGQKNFGQYAKRIGSEWSDAPDKFNELYFRQAIARNIVFRTAEKLVTEQPWYNGGYRANIVAYALASIGELARRRKSVVDFQKVWGLQAAPEELREAIVAAAEFANEDVSNPPPGSGNVTEWAKRDACWNRILARLDELTGRLPSAFLESLIEVSDQRSRQSEAKRVQRLDNGIDAQARVIQLGGRYWARLLSNSALKKRLSPKEVGVLQIAERIPAKLPSEKQCLVLIEILEKARLEGIAVEA